MPSKSLAQRRFMSAAAHNPEFARKAGIPQSVAAEFHNADKGKYGAGRDDGGGVDVLQDPIPNAPEDVGSIPLGDQFMAGNTRGGEHYTKVFDPEGNIRWQQGDNQWLRRPGTRAEGGVAIDPEVQRVLDENRMRNLTTNALLKTPKRAYGGPMTGMAMGMPPPNVPASPGLGPSLMMPQMSMPGRLPASFPQPTAGVGLPAPAVAPSYPMVGAQRAGMAAGGQPPWYIRAEARGAAHTGPIMSTVPGRTDRHNMSVPAGSYVMPAHSVSHLGQSNTMAGMALLKGMFSGPYGVGGKLPHGAVPKMGAGPKVSFGKPPKLSDEGGSRSGSNIGTPVPVVTAGGEYVIPPEAIIARWGDLGLGHKILDAWNDRIQKEHAKTIRNLPPPAKK